jgi:putative transcriptional regulator
MASSKFVGTSLEGQLLIAMPGMVDERFKKAVIFVCGHSSDGTMGIVINKPAKDMTFDKLLEQLNLKGDAAGAKAISVYSGGPVETGRGFVLHSPDYALPNHTTQMHKDVCLTATMDVLSAIARGQGPHHALLALGYAGWGPGQLEAELGQNSWLHGMADAELLFSTPFEERYDAALKRIGVNSGMLSAVAGHA